VRLLATLSLASLIALVPFPAHAQEHAKATFAGGCF
jgi:hypothetical protein